MEDAYWVVHTQDEHGAWKQYGFFTPAMAHAVRRNHVAHGRPSYIELVIA